MNKRMTLLAERRERLVALAAQQRYMLAQDIEAWRSPLALADKGLTALQYVRSHPAWILGGIALLAIVQPRHAGKWLGRGWVAWQLLHKSRGSRESNPH